MAVKSVLVQHKKTNLLQNVKLQTEYERPLFNFVVEYAQEISTKNDITHED